MSAGSIKIDFAITSKEKLENAGSTVQSAVNVAVKESPALKVLGVKNDTSETFWYLLSEL